MISIGAGGWWHQRAAADAVRWRRRTCKGTPDENIDRIFDRFDRVDPDRVRKSVGTGHAIVQAHGSEIRVESTVGRGTRFWFDLDYAEKEANEV